MHRLDVFGSFRIVTQRLAQLRDLAHQSIFGDVGSVPDALEDLFLFHQPHAILNQEEQQAKGLRLKLNRVARLERTEGRRLDPHVIEEKR